MNDLTFIDTSYILALKFYDDQFHHEAKMVAPTVAHALTTEATLIEIGNALSRSDWKKHGIKAISDIRNDKRIEVLRSILLCSAVLSTYTVHAWTKIGALPIASRSS